MRTMRRISLAYLAILHIAIAIVLWKSDFLLRVKRTLSGPPPVSNAAKEYIKEMLRYHVRMDGNVPDGAVVFIGDSLIQGLATDAVAYPSVNYGIGKDTTAGVLERLTNYHSLSRASAVVLAIGVNDMVRLDNAQIVQNYARILERLPRVPIVCSAVLPFNESIYGRSLNSNVRIIALNAALKELCARDTRCVFMDAGRRLIGGDTNLLVEFQEGDGVHLNNAGNRIWIEELRKALAQIRFHPISP